MGFRFACARAMGALTTWGLRSVLRRTAGNFPGKLGLYIDPQLIGHLRSKIKTGSFVVVGTNGKTTVTNMVADVLEAAGNSVVCNRDGANLDSGVATNLLQTKPVDWGVLESDELWLAKTLPQLKSDYVLLLNLFRDQLDRCGEIDHIQDAIIRALGESPETTLVYNADDPQCAAVAAKVGNPRIAFGIDEDLRLPQNTVSDAEMCQLCEGMLEYGYRQYGQLGTFRCPECGFSRPALDCKATDVVIEEEGASFTLTTPTGSWNLTTPFGGAYMVYNVVAVAVAAQLAGCDRGQLQAAIDAFNPNNGRLQALEVAGRPTLLNLAKNPTGFNQNLKLVTQGEGPRAVAFFINDKEADGHDVSWLWDIDFEELSCREDLVVFAGGIRAYDMQVRLKYAGIDAQIVRSAADMFQKIGHLPNDVKAYLIANYTALPGVKADVERLARASSASEEDKTKDDDPKLAAVNNLKAAPVPQDIPPVVIAHLFPDLLNLYGDGGNVTVLQRRLQWRGLPVEIRSVRHGQKIDLREVDLVVLGGSPDREQRLASFDLVTMKDDLKAFVESDGALLAICGGYQILGSTWLLDGEEVPGLGIVDMRTGRAEGGSTNRLIENIALKSSIASAPVVGYENHAGRTFLGEGVKPFGSVASHTGCGNNERDKADGVLYKSVIGTYLHGPLLAKNPQVADYLLERALRHRAQRLGVDVLILEPLDDAEELAANNAMAMRLHAL